MGNRHHRHVGGGACNNETAYRAVSHYCTTGGKISATYPGADAKTVQDTVTQIIEQNMNGIDNLMYMSSTSDSSGSVTITLTFDSGTDPDIAQVQVQNKLSLATRCCRKKFSNRA